MSYPFMPCDYFMYKKKPSPARPGIPDRQGIDTGRLQVQGCFAAEFKASLDDLARPRLKIKRRELQV